MAKLRQAKIQSHFQFGRLVSSFLPIPQDDDDTRALFVTDSSGKTSKASSGEYNVALALRTLKLEFQFQVSIAGGRGRAFGLVLDFFVMTVPMPTPVWVHGEYYHSGDRREKDLLQQDAVREYMQGAINEPIEIWFSECDTEEKALLSARRALR